MPRARKIQQQRLTRAPLKRKNHKKEDGRPKGTLKKYKFEQTRLGFMLKYEVPLVYDILMEASTPCLFTAPPVRLVKAVCGASDDASLRKPKFQRYLADYESNGLCCKRAKILTPERKVYYDSIRKKKMAAYIRKNKKRIDLLKGKTEL